MAANDAVVPVENTELDLSVHPSGIVPQLQNVVATVNLGVQLDLKAIALHARNAEYNPKRFAAVIMRIREPKTTALIFASGKMVCTGAKSEEDSKLAARKYCKIIQKLGFAATFKEFKIQNIVGSCDVRFPIRLEGLAVNSQLFCTYEPELFPGLIYRMKIPKIVLLIFVSGKIVLTGAKQRKEIYEAFENIYPILQEFRKGDAAAMPPPAPTPAQPQQQATAMLPPSAKPRLPAAPSHNLPPPTPAHAGLPPPTPLNNLPPATPAHGLPPPTPSHQGLPPATPAYELPAAGQFAPPLPR